MAKYNVGDKINFLEYEYCLEPVGHRYYWNIINKPSGADKIFKYIHLEKNSFSKKVLGYYYKDTVFPEMETLEDVEKLTDALLLECAKFRYPVGTTYISVAGNEYKAERLPYFFNKKGDIAVKEGGGLVYENCNNKWAEVVEEPKVEIKFEVGKWYTFYTVDKKYHLIAKCGGTTEINFLFADRWYISNLIKKEADSIAIEYMIEPTLLTNLSIIQQYLPEGHPDLIKEEFVLPERWHVVVTEENQDVLSKWRFKEYCPNNKLTLGKITGICNYEGNPEHNPATDLKGENYDFGTEITFEQFKKYVLKEEVKEFSEEEFKVGDWIIFTDLKATYREHNGDIVQITDINPDKVYTSWINHTPKSFSGGGFGLDAYKKCFRKARLEEILLKKLDPVDIPVNIKCPELEGYPLDPRQIWWDNYRKTGFFIYPEIKLNNPFLKSKIVYLESKTTLSIDDDELPMVRPREEVKVTKQLSID